jgi:hypothetical protein
VEERSDNKLDKSQESTIKNQIRNSAIDDIGVVINYVVYLTNQEFQAYYEHLRTVRDVFFKEEQQKSVQAKLDILLFSANCFFKLEL